MTNRKATKTIHSLYDKACALLLVICLDCRVDVLYLVQLK